MPECCERHKQRSPEEIKCLTTRLNRIAGQVNGIRRMIEEDRYCVDILMQVSAVQAALKAFDRELMAAHIRSCVVDDIRAGNDQVVDELCDLIKQTL